MKQLNMQETEVVHLPTRGKAAFPERQKEFAATQAIGTLAEVDERRRLVRFYQKEGLLRRGSPVVFRYDELRGYRLMEDGKARRLADLGYGFAGEDLPDGNIMGSHRAAPGQKLRKHYVYQMQLLVTVCLPDRGPVCLCLHLVSFRTTTDSVGYRRVRDSVERFAALMDSILQRPSGDRQKTAI